MADHRRLLEVIRVPRPTPYAAMYERQCNRWRDVAEGNEPPALFLLEHAPVITLGRETDPSHLLKTPEEYRQAGIAVESIDRGGDVTYHGPGQLVAYPILDLKAWGMSIRGYLRALEDVIIQTIAAYGIQGRRVEGLTGVWTDEGKIAAIGISARKWVTYHGIALNVAPNMDHFGLIVPCGIPDRPVTALNALTEPCPSVNEVMDVFDRAFGREFRTKIPYSA